MGLFDQDRADTNPEVADKADEIDGRILEDGIYFNLPEDQYHALHRLSASGMKNILISIPTFWAKSWMNPEVADKDEDDTKAQILGRAYHVAIFEPETLAHRYAGEPDLDSFEGMVMTDTGVKAALKEYGAPQSKAGELSIDRAHRLADLGFAKPIKAIVMAEFEEALGNRRPIASKYWTQIMRDLERIKANPEIYDLVNGGASEVTILWTCPDSGIQMKARLDKLKHDIFVDLKSFANSNGKPVNQAIHDQVQFYKYYLSMRAYQVAIRMIGQLNLQIMDAPTDDQLQNDDSFPPEAHQSLIETLRMNVQAHQAWLFFQEKGGIPNLLARKLKLQRFPEGVDMQSTGAEDHTFSQSDGVLCRKADVEIQRAKQLFLQAMTIYGPDQEWYPMDMIGEIGDEHFRDYFLDSMPA